METVVDRCRSGDQRAFEQVVALHGPRVLRVARLIVRDGAMAEDVCQETFLKAWRRIGTLREQDIGSWLIRIAANESISASRRRHRWHFLAERLGRFGSTSSATASETRLDLSRALDRLTPQLRAAIILHYYQDLTVDETARALRIPVNTLKSRLKSALRRLREFTGAQEESV